MALRYFGVVTCGDRSAVVEVTDSEARDLACGRLPCPCCGQRCGSRLRAGAALDATQSMAWGGTRWLAGDPNHER